MTGLLIVNSFIDSAKFSELYKMLADSAKKLGISLKITRSGDIPHSLEHVKNVPCDFVIFWDKDVLLAEMFEICGVRVFNSSSAIYCCDNKGYTAMRLAQANIRIPKTFVAPLTFEGVGYNDLSFARDAVDRLGYPVIVKELYGSFGQQVYMAENGEELNRIIEKIGSKGFLIQEFIETASGRDVRINVVGDRVVSSMLRYSVNGDFRSNITNGGRMQKYEANAAQVKAAIDACRALKLDFAGVDVLFGKSDDDAIICEVNSNPHFKSSLDCTGVDMGLEILKYIRERVL